MVHALVSLAVSALLLLVISKIVPGFTVDGCGSAVFAALVVGVANATVGFILKVLMFPLTILTLGLFLLVINALMLLLAAAIVPGFRIKGFGPAFLAAVLLAIANLLLRR